MTDVMEPQRPSDGDIITWFGHACFRITDADGHTVVVDPYDDKVLGQSLDGLSADVVIITHEHHDHNYVEGLRARHVIHALDLTKDMHVRRVGDSPTGIVFNLVPTFHDEEHGHARGGNVAVVWQEGGIVFCHLGDLGHTLTPEQVQLIGRPDVLMLPVGGFYTIDGKEAQRVVQQLNPHLIIPMHYKIPGMTAADIPITTEEPFLDTDGTVPWHAIKHLNSPSLNIDVDHLPVYSEVEVLTPATILH